MKYMITGGTGSLGRALIRRLLASENEVVVFSRDEGKHALYFSDMPVVCEIGDVRDIDRLRNVIIRRSPNVIIHAAALKRIDDLEFSPDECFKTNVNGTSNVINASADSNVSVFTLVSTDKAVLPVNCYGASKLMAERLVSHAARTYERIKFSSVRYGNVIASRGSFIPLWASKIMSGKPVTVTSFGCTRFLFTLDDAVDAVLMASARASLGEIYVPKMNAYQMQSVINALEFFTKKQASTTLIGMRPGEKLHELIVSELEAQRTFDVAGIHVVMPEGIDRTPFLARRQTLFSHPSIPIGKEISSNGCIDQSQERLTNMIIRGLEIAG